MPSGVAAYLACYAVAMRRRTFCIKLILSSLRSSFPLPAKTYATLTDGLVPWWTFNGLDTVSIVADRSGSGNTGYLMGFTSATPLSATSVRRLVCVGDDYVDMGRSISLLAVTLNVTPADFCSLQIRPKYLARPKRFELLTPRFVVWCSQIGARNALSQLSPNL